MKNNNQQNQSQHWADKVVAGILKWQSKNQLPQLHVDDMKTPSGRVHTGALRGVVLHDLIAKILETHEQRVVSTYVFNDMDPMDGLPAYLDAAEYQQHMGKPLYKIPKPLLEKSGLDLSILSAEEKADLEKAQNFAELYAFDFMQAFRRLGCSQEIVWSHQLYESGQMDSMIRVALDHVTELRQIYKEVAHYDLPEEWYPFQVICPQCGKVGTTLVTDWDGRQVTFECQAQKVTWAEGCGYQGKISPFGGSGKLLWKVDWPAHWATMGVNVEGAGKDHSSAGGSRDMADAQCRRVFQITVPFNIPYEWILIRGAKMSSSKGVGTSACEFTRLFPANVGRFLFVSRNYSQVIDFDPQGMAIPDLFDEFDQAARIYWGLEKGDQRLGRAFQLSEVAKMQTGFLPRFRDLAMWMQYPELNLAEEFAKVKGEALTEAELKLLEERQTYAQLWLEHYAPEEYQLTVRKELPAAAQELTAAQKEFLLQLSELLSSRSWQAEKLQQAIFELAKDGIGAKAAFSAIYLLLLGKQAGPRAAWLLLNTDKKLLERRFAALEL